MAIITTTEKVKVQGVPGEEQRLLVFFATTDFPFESRPISVPGLFRVQFLLARPGRLRFLAHEPSFLTSVVGSSHLGVTKPASQRVSDSDVIGMVLDTHGENWSLQFKCLVNDEGFLGKIVVEDLRAQSYVEAEAIAYRALMPFLSRWSVTLDIPLAIETIQVTDLTTHTEMLSIRAPFVEMRPGGGVGPPLFQEFCQHASLYREGMNTDSPFYRFLCFYKIVESLYVRRSENAKSAKHRGEEPRKYTEEVPLSKEAILGILAIIYPWRSDLNDDLAIAQILQDEAKGKKFRAVKEKHLEPLRDKIAHGLMRSGQIEAVADRLEDLNATTKWLPLLRVWVRLLLRIEFPTEFGVTG